MAKEEKEELGNPNDMIRDWLKDSAEAFGLIEGAFVTNFVLIAEYMDVSGEYYTFSLRDESRPVWQSKGLITHVVESDFAVDNVNIDFEFEGDE